MQGETGKDGLIHRSIQMLFDQMLEMISLGATDVSISVEAVEIYNESIKDLLSDGTDLDIEKGVVVGNHVAPTGTVEEALRLFEEAGARRRVNETASNPVSSRSHMVFSLHFQAKLLVSGEVKERSGKLNLCDLAGNESQKSDDHYNVRGPS
jgi:Kinesin motor domain